MAVPLKLIKLSYLEEKDTLTGSFFTSLSLSLTRRRHPRLSSDNEAHNMAVCFARC